MSLWLTAEKTSLIWRGVVDFVVTISVYFYTREKTKLVYYISPTAWIQYHPPAPQPPQAANLPALQPVWIGTGTLFIWNAGKAAAENVQIGHHDALPAHGVLPDVQRNELPLPGGGSVIEFPSLPPKTLISISYLFFLPAASVENFVSYVQSRAGSAKRIPVMLQRVWPQWVNIVIGVLLLAGLWFATDLAWKLAAFVSRSAHG